MIKSMTGYGKATSILEGGRLTVEIRSVNGKGADIGIKTSMLPKEKEMEVRRRIAEKLRRGSIDLFLNWEPDSEGSAAGINTGIATEYCRQLVELASKAGLSGADEASSVLPSVLRMPGVMDSQRGEIINESNWPLVEKAIDEALDNIDAYRATEGEALYRDVTTRVRTILDLYDQVEAYEPERAANVRERIEKAAHEASLELDGERFEQEMVFYLEKYDISEERVRLRQHCKYFFEVIDSEECPGKKLGFIIQEMGREINTTGSKANHASIQKCVVRMKDELEKIREQSMNIL